MIVYLAGPMSGYENYNFAAFNRAAQALRNAGVDVISPAETAGGVKHLGREFYFRYDFAILAMVDAVILLEGWEDSPGAKAEVICATEMGKPCYLWDGDTFDEDSPLNVRGWNVELGVL